MIPKGNKIVIYLLHKKVKDQQHNPQVCINALNIYHIYVYRNHMTISDIRVYEMKNCKVTETGWN